MGNSKILFSVWLSIGRLAMGSAGAFHGSTIS